MANLTVIIPVYNEERAANVVAANLAACTAKGVCGEVFNIACGRSYTLLQLVEALNHILGTAIEPLFKSRAPDMSSIPWPTSTGKRKNRDFE